ncbi:hypothetical protein [Bacillus infantis]|uniref:hypothetical protein n=1 Tax=Bacillus infantis TaxID=324767 RepID=UPI003CF08058
MRSLIANKLAAIWKEIGESCLDSPVKHGSKVDAVRQQIYLLQHYPVLLHEYYLMSSLILESKWIVPPWKLISFKCGSAIDYDAFYAAACEQDIDIFTYTGIDEEIWCGQSEVPPNKLKLVRSAASDLPGGELDEVSLIVFPKSLKSFTSRDFEAISQQLQRTDMKRKRLCMAFSASDPESPEYELNRFHSLLEQAARWQKYRICKEETVHIQTETAFEYADGRFEYPQKILAKMREKRVPSSIWPVERLEHAYMKAVFLEAR